MAKIKAEFTNFNSNSNWVAGTAGKYTFEAKLYDVGSKFGINGGRVSKLKISDEAQRERGANNFDSCIVSYERGWDIEPKTEEEKEVYRAVLDLLENSPKRFDQ